ncbi:hypothetical protein NSMM_340049 [Nitrosomonas mobilis]|uniref:Uncharacterized protein n=1 Tax=Nitrosomonas mobilis TaxID=51642 RepID=A0A1G5SD45_9PROT|nr:hypothetical protein NSMM_340049 [Nitrosomonas mobilis]
MTPELISPIKKMRIEFLALLVSNKKSADVHAWTLVMSDFQSKF